MKTVQQPRSRPEGTTPTPAVFYVMMAALVLALLYFIVLPFV